MLFGVRLMRPQFYHCCGHQTLWLEHLLKQWSNGSN